jgi:hypothetical protein
MGYWSWPEQQKIGEWQQLLVLANIAGQVP